LIEQNKKIYNAMPMLSKKNELVDYYFKIKLFSILEKNRALFSSFFPVKKRDNIAQGVRPKTMTLNGIHFTPAICSEILYPSFIRN